MHTNTRRTAEEMYPIVEAWQQSGLSQKTFCNSQDLSPSVLSYWIRRYRSDSPGSTPGFVPLHLGEPVQTSPMASGQPANHHPTLEVVLPSGTRFNFYQAIDKDLLDQLLSRC